MDEDSREVSVCVICRESLSDGGAKLYKKRPREFDSGICGSR